MNKCRTVRELGKDELEQLKHAYYYQLVESDNDVLGNLDNWLDIPDEVIFNHYDGITFVPNDFHSEDHWSDEKNSIQIILTCPHCGNSTWIKRDNGEYECAACEDTYYEADMCYTEKLC